MKKIKNEHKHKKLPVLIILCFFAIGVFATGLLFFNRQAEEDAQVLRWNSDASLIDDRLQKEDPVFMLLSHGYLESGYYTATVFVLYNDGKYVTDYLVSDSQENYLKNTQGTQLVDLLKNDYETATTSQLANSFTDNKKPGDVRNAYLKQYDISSYEMESQVNMRSDVSSMEIYGVVYDDNLKPSLICYYMEFGNSTKQILDRNGLKVLEWIMDEETVTKSSTE